MKIGIFLYGIVYGGYAKHNNIVFEKDLRHCWPNTKEMLVDPLISKGHTVDVFLSTYKPSDLDVYNEILNKTNPTKTIYYEHQKTKNHRGSCG